jgi:hypothetical protein
MKGLLIKKLLIFSVMICMAIPAFPGFSNGRYKSDIPSGELFISSSVKKKKAKAKKPPSAMKAQKKQDVKESKKKKDSKKAVKEFQKHALEIQSPEVRERIKQNRKNSDATYKSKKKNNASRSRKAGKKYK